MTHRNGKLGWHQRLAEATYALGVRPLESQSHLKKNEVGGITLPIPGCTSGPWRSRQCGAGVGAGVRVDGAEWEAGVGGVGKAGRIHYTTYKNELKWIGDLDVQPKTVELLEENMGNKPSDVTLSNISLDMSP